MKRVGVRDFRDHATRYLAGDEALTIERHGEPIGFYIPVGASRRESPVAFNRKGDFVQALERLEQTVDRILMETGLTEDALSRLFDLNEPLPEPRERQLVAPTVAADASGC